MEKIIILDRDGVINYDSKDYIKSPDEWQPIPGSIEAIAKLNQSGYQVAIATNQSGVARGLFSLETLAQIHHKLINYVENAGGTISLISFCPHGPDDGCSCRKPQPGLFLNIADKLAIEIRDAFAVGDSLRDLQAATSAGCQAVLVKTGNGQGVYEQKLYPENTLIFDDLAHFANHVLSS